MGWILGVSCLIFCCVIPAIHPANDKSSSKMRKPRNLTKWKDNHVDVEDYGWDIWCKMQPNGNDCMSKGVLTGFYFDVSLQDCATASFGTHCAHNLNYFSHLDVCHNTCHAPGRHTEEANLAANISCRLQPDFGDCNDYHSMYYFDVTTRGCRGFSFSGCGGNRNRFPTSQQCIATCGPAVAP